MGTESNESEAGRFLQSWRFELNRLEHYLNVSVKQYDITIEGILGTVAKYQNYIKEGIHGRREEWERGIADLYQRLALYNAWKPEEINEQRLNIFLKAIQIQEAKIRELQITLPADLDVRNSKLAKEARVIDNKIVFLSPEEKEKKTQEVVDKIEEEYKKFFGSSKPGEGVEG